MTESAVPADAAQASAVARPSTLPPRTEQPSSGGLDSESRRWLLRLRSDTRERDTAMKDLHGLLHSAATFEVRRRAKTVGPVRGDDLADIAVQAADDALVAVLAKLGEYRGASRFTTWAYKFALLEAAMAMRRRGSQSQEVVLADEQWSLLAHAGPSPNADAQTRELLRAIADAVREELTPHQREVLVTLAVDGVPIDVLAERLNTTRGALYKTLHDARRKLRRRLTVDGLMPSRANPDQSHA